VLETMIARAADSTGARAARLLLENDAGAKLATILHGENITRALKVSVALGHTEDARAVPLLAALVEGDAADANLAAQSVRGLSRTKIGAERLLALARDGKLAPELEVIAGLALSRAPWREVRREAATTLPRPKIQGDTTLPPIRTLLRRSGDTQRGETVFARLCQECHQIGSSGKDFGPALTEIGDKLGKDALLLSILDPNAGISFDYEGELLLTKDGNEVVGLVISETDDTVVVKARGAIVTEYRKSDILSRRRLTGSIMPSALEASMSEDELVDLVEYLSHCRKPH
jgi:putative heme-binding domain-containing protein